MKYIFEKICIALNSVSSFLTITLCFLSLIFIYDKWKKDEISRKYTELTAVQFIFGLISGIINCVAKMEVFIDESHVIIYLDYFNKFNKKINIFVIGISILFLYFNIAMPSAILVSRNLVIVKKKVLKTQHIFLLFLIVFFFALELSIATILCYNSNNNGNLLYNISMKKPIFIQNISPYSYCSLFIFIKKNFFFKGSIHFFIILLSNALFFNANFIVFFFQYRSYRKYMKQYSRSMTSKTKKMHSDFIKILYLQNLTPVLITGLPILIMVVSIFFKFNIFIYTGTTYLIFFINFVPAINAFFYIFLPLGNRKIIKNFIKNLLGKNTSNNVKTLNIQTTRIQ
ncbi:7TM GPCR, serpentine receptor class r (Str) family-containing protein [Strongyloides ratti]|uniref:7TM GPCR, serpentine receptor class r (Str) family-containing protein n=1 Tax=Strongyloides ratti TaxID=34506 RepID=A0A090KTM4_STRRB|nr:7TM GPCR, serpentine receptor class r (Str) family-containing protein [Strongyloides ratti]CEF60870.1 7TM GPCR, serpentine receptor class r (Str) family-containing protein [Strongyloides ratti]